MMEMIIRILTDLKQDGIRMIKRKITIKRIKRKIIKRRRRIIIRKRKIKRRIIRKIIDGVVMIQMIVIVMIGIEIEIVIVIGIEIEIHMIIIGIIIIGIIIDGVIQEIIIIINIIMYMVEVIIDGEEVHGKDGIIKLVRFRILREKQIEAISLFKVIKLNVSILIWIYFCKILNHRII